MLSKGLPWKACIKFPAPFCHFPESLSTDWSQSCSNHLRVRANRGKLYSISAAPVATNSAVPVCFRRGDTGLRKTAGSVESKADSCWGRAIFSETVSWFSPNLRSPWDFHCLHRRAPAPALTTLSRVCFPVVAFGGRARYNDFFFVFLGNFAEAG